MSDYNLTPAEWRLARQAGASFLVEDTVGVETAEGQQLALDGLLPHPGDTYRNIHSDTIGCVVSVTQRRYAWVRMRANGRVTEIPMDWLEKHWRPCSPDGTPR